MSVGERKKGATDMIAAIRSRLEVDPQGNVVGLSGARGSVGALADEECEYEHLRDASRRFSRTSRLVSAVSLTQRQSHRLRTMRVADDQRRCLEFILNISTDVASSFFDCCGNRLPVDVIQLAAIDPVEPQ